VHPELFELKALVAGRLDAHRRREIDDHLGSCADCSRHYVALMLGSSSPKTAEAEARTALVPQGSGTVLTLGGGPATVEMYGIDAPLSPSVPKAPARSSSGTGITLETEFPASSRTQVPVSSSLVDAIAKLRAESDAAKATAAPMPVKTPTPTLAPHIVEPVVESAFIEPSIFLPTPADGISIIRGEPTPSSIRVSAERPAFMTRQSPAASLAAQPELVVTFSSTPPRIPSYRSPSSVTVVTPASDRDYVSQAVQTHASSQPRSDYLITETTVGAKPTSMKMGLMMGGVALAAMLALSGYRYFQSSVTNAASAAASEAAQRVQAAAARATLAAPIAAAPAPPPQVQTRIVYVREPAKRSSAETRSPEVSSAPSTATPLSVSLPDVNVSTGSAESAIQANTQRGATSELTRTARATSTRTAAPRPY
jgi:hypothetical protein